MKPLLYPIRAVSQQTGISIDTLRAWERRYQAVTPQRDGRGRLFSAADIRRLHLLRAAVEQGHAIGQIASRSDEELQDLLLTPRLKGNESAPSTLISPSPGIELRAIKQAIEQMDYAMAEREMAWLAALLAPRELVHHVALPLMQQVGADWHAGRLSVAQEHMTSALLRNLLGGLVPLHRRISVPNKLLFATPSGELHEFGILLAAMMAVGGGLGIIYLGTNLPADEIVRAAQKTAPQAVVLGVTGAQESPMILKEIQTVADRLPTQIELWVGGMKNADFYLEVSKIKALIIDDFVQLEQHLIRLGARY
jgi:MerR family transcriptional regulator, light-induced transcriptional regulator